MLADARCEACGAHAPDGHADHVHPHALGGLTTMGNAQWLCASCNLAKGARPGLGARGRHVLPKPAHNGVGRRRWQGEFLPAFLAATREPGRRRYFLGAAVGSGKTIAALLAYLAGDFDMIVVLTPKTGIRGSWTSDAAKVGIRLQTVMGSMSIEDGRRVMPHGYVLTAQMIPSVAAYLDRLCQMHRVLVVVDEAHHFAAGLAWSAQADAALAHAAFWLHVSGTPYRHDDREIAGLRYVRHGNRAEGTPDFRRSYAETLRDGLVAPIICRFLGGSVTRVNLNGTRETYDYADGDYTARTGRPQRQRMAERLRLSTLASDDYQHAALREAVGELDRYRQDGQPWGGLLVCATIRQAQALHRHLTGTLGQPALLLVDEADTEDGVARFEADHGLRWIVSITKVSEGVSVPRLRVALMLTNVTATQTLEQVRGRLARLLNGVGSLRQEATLFLMADPRLIAFARRSNEMVLHEVPWLAPGDGDDHARAMARLRAAMADRPEGDAEAHVGPHDDPDMPAHIRRLGDALRDEAQYRPIHLGDFRLYARPALDGAVIGSEFVSEDEFLALRERLAQFADPFVAMSASRELLEAALDLAEGVAP
ncbi:DEAD/DEAH box helicase family protein [Roseomonas sp. PWR1]|uniref:DEAD/DEAH box helicase family protein n=1 Tax=Roseomonas nitratireducens TaxID=2820810 RepID=A0ABS4AQT6_9PROT|nr:DEAD/DEAH box helicase family protein [Neoroseomonas nitratireducens]MBP0463604.1 DEAD/DEAH box helicase family protein [Neoroseomonas nitratireducens]